MKIYLNGKLVDTKEAKISIFDRGFMYGDGAFESLRTYNKEPFLLKEHLKRLSSACKLLKIKIKFPEKKIRKIIKIIIKLNRLKEAYIKIIVTRGEAKGHGLSIKKVKGNPLLLITAEELNPQPKYCKVTIFPHPRAIWIGSKMKSLNYLEHIFARMFAEEKGADEAIFMDQKGNILEGTTSNIFIVKKGVLLTPPTSAPILPGVTRAYVIKLARNLKIKVKEKLFKRKELQSAKECFITSSGVGILPVKTGKVTKLLMEKYSEKI